MKNHIKSITLLGLMFMASAALNAQSIVSKDVQRVANKKAFESEEFTKSNIQAVSQPFSAMVISKGIVSSTDTAPQGNIVSKGYPTWAISKGVARKNQERIQGTPALNSRDEISFGGDEISRK